MERTQLVGEDANVLHHPDLMAQIEAENQYTAQQQTLHARMQRRLQPQQQQQHHQHGQQQQQPQQQQRHQQRRSRQQSNRQRTAQASSDPNGEWNRLEAAPSGGYEQAPATAYEQTPVTAYDHPAVSTYEPQTPISAYPSNFGPHAPYSDPPQATLPYSPPEDDYYNFNSAVNAGGYTDVQAQLHSALYGGNLGFDTSVDTTNLVTQPRGYNPQDTFNSWQMVPNSSGIDNQFGLPTTTGIDDQIQLPPTSGTEDFQYYDSLSPDYLNGGVGLNPYNNNNICDELTYQHALDQSFDEFLSPPEQNRGFVLMDSPVPELDCSQADPSLNPWLPQERFEHTPETIDAWFAQNYASKKSQPISGKIMSEQNGGIWCRLCNPYTYHDSLNYRHHKEEIHGIDFRTGFHYWAPMKVQRVEGVLGLGFEGYCPTCQIWIPLDMSKPDFNWFQHASTCQDHTVPHDPKPASPIDRYTSASSDEEGADIGAIKREATKRARAGDTFLRPNPSYTNNSNSNPSDESGSTVWSSASSRSVLTSNSNSNSSANSAMSQHSLESRRKKVLRLRKRRGARSANQQGPRVYQCTFCIADFANYGDWRRHEEVIHLVLEKWVCAPEGQYKSGTRECVYCDEIHEEQSNIPNRCNASYCHGKGPTERVFARKDHLKQHLRRMHGITTWRDTFEGWLNKAKGPRQSRCGFCGATFEDWQQRMHHVGWEFKHGQKMEVWQGDWGLESIWMQGKKLNGAILPKERKNHVTQNLKKSINEKPPSPNPRTKSAPPVSDIAEPLSKEKGKRALTRKPRLTGLRDQAHSTSQQVAPQSIGSSQYGRQADVHQTGTSTDLNQYQYDLQSQRQPTAIGLGLSQYQQDFQAATGYDQYCQPSNQSAQTQALTPPVSWSHPSSATTPPSRQSPLAPYSNNHAQDFSQFAPLYSSQPYSTETSPQLPQQQQFNHPPPPLLGSNFEVPIIQSSSGRGTTEKKKQGSFQCNMCAMRYTRQDNLRRHMKSHFSKGDGG